MHVTTRIVDESNRHYHECDGLGIPWVHVDPRTKYAKVEWDCHALPQRLRDQIQNDDEHAQARILEVFHRHSNKKSRYDFSIYAGHFDNLLPEDAEQAAEELFELLTSVLPVAVGA